MKVPTICAILVAGAWSSWSTAVSLADDVLAPLDLRQVQVGGEIGRRIDLTVNNNLLVLDVDHAFLAPFVAKTTREGYIGLGKLIGATVHFAAYTKNEKVLALKKHLIETTIGAQQPDGYIGMMAPEARMWGLWDLNEIPYIISGLTTDYRCFGERRSLDAARKAADYILQRWSTMPADWSTRNKVAMWVEVLNLDRAMLALHQATKDRRYLDFTIQQLALPQWDLGIVMGRRDQINGHAYAYLNRCLAQLDLFRLQPQANLLRPTRRAMQFLTAQDGMTITGATGQSEMWTDDQHGRNCLGETCATTYQLLVYDSLLRLEGVSVYGDLMERAIYNALFAAQSPDGRQIRYYTPFEGNRVYFGGDTFCCPNNYRRIVAELPTMVYYRSKAGAAVNLYTPSDATISLDNDVSLRIRQETEYPSSGHVVLRLDPSKPASFPLQLRIPRWCQKATVAVNGQPLPGSIAAGAFFAVERQWKAGDQVTLDLPMTWRLVLGRQRQAGRAAVMRGPLVFCLNPAQNESLRSRDAADLNYMMLDPASLKQSTGGDALRPNGVACEIKAGDDWAAIGCSRNLQLKLNEFPDPEGKCVYFRLPDLSMAVPDELSGAVETANTVTK